MTENLSTVNISGYKFLNIVEIMQNYRYRAPFQTKRIL